MFKPKFSLIGLLGVVAVVCAGLTFYDIATQDQLPVMRRHFLTWCWGSPPGLISDPEERVYIAGPSDSEDIYYSPDF